MTGNTAQQPAVIMILPPQPFAIMVQLERKIDLVACTAKFRRLVQRLQECLLVKRRLRFHQLIVHPLQKRIFAVGERVVLRFLNREI